MPSLAVCTASSRDPKWPYTFCIAQLMANLKGFERATLNIELGSVCQMARHRLVDIARRDGYSHILFIDDDMRFPADCADRLLARNKPIVAANYVCRVFPVVPLSAKNGERVYSNGKSGLESVDHAPAGMMMIETSVFDRLPMPWFNTQFLPETPSEYMGEDVFFCRLAREHGYDVWIDHDLSHEIGHVGGIEFHEQLAIPPEKIPSLVELVKREVAA